MQTDLQFQVNSTQFSEVVFPKRNYVELCRELSRIMKIYSTFLFLFNSRLCYDINVFILNAS